MLKSNVLVNEFAAHGSVLISAEERILIVEATGPWNIEMMNLYFQQCEPLKKAFPSDGWGVLLIAKGEPFILEEAVPASIENIINDKQAGRRATAIIIEPNYGYHLSKSLFTRMYERASESYRFFEHRGSALAWLRGVVGD